MIFINLLLAIGLNLYKALVFMFLFNWFIVGYFGFSELSYLWSLALITTISFLKLKGDSIALDHYTETKMNKSEVEIKRMSQIIAIFVVMNIMWFVAWIIKINL